MHVELDRAEALRYFSEPDHPRSFETLDGLGTVMLSAPHAVLQTRKGTIKAAERYTGMLCLLMNRRESCPCIYKTSHRNDDANFDAQSDYRDELCRYIRAKNIRYLLDLHQLHPNRPMDVCLGTGGGANLLGDPGFLNVVRNAFGNHGFRSVTVDEPFGAFGRNTVSATVARVCAVPAIQVELNSRLLMENNPGERFSEVLETLGEIRRKLDKAATEEEVRYAKGTDGGQRLSENEQI